MANGDLIIGMRITSVDGVIKSELGWVTEKGFESTGPAWQRILPDVTSKIVKLNDFAHLIVCMRFVLENPLDARWFDALRDVVDRTQNEESEDGSLRAQPDAGAIWECAKRIERAALVMQEAKRFIDSHRTGA